MKKLSNNTVYMNIKPIALALIAAGILSACGGGGGGSSTNTGGISTPPPSDGGGSNPPPGGGTNPPPGGGSTPDTAMTMSCVDGTEYQCSGGTVIKTDNGVMLTRSGVQVFGISTSDVPLNAATQANRPPNVDSSVPSGFALPSFSPEPINGVAEVRIAKDAATKAVTRVGLLLDDYGLSWNGTAKRPQIVEAFLTTKGRVELDPTTKALVFKDLPTGAQFFDFNRQTKTGTQGNYANNTFTPDAEGISNNLKGTWRTADGTEDDYASVGRLHEDGDIDIPAAAVPATGTKGYRDFVNVGYEFVNLSSWTSQDTVYIADWLTVSRIEHNKERRGYVAFGNVTEPGAVPATGTATYTGKVYGLYGLASSTQIDPDPFEARATIEVNYETGAVQIRVEGTPAQVPAFTGTASRGAITVNGADTSAPNYFTGTVAASGFAGGLSGRYFGASAKEVGGTFQMQGPSGVTIIGGFIGRKP